MMGYKPAPETGGNPGQAWITHAQSDLVGGGLLVLQGR
jgi:hypothetical protein